MSEFLRLNPDNFNYLYMHRLDAMVKSVTPELMARRGVNPGLDDLAVSGIAYAKKFKSSIEEGTVAATLVENKRLHTVEGLLVVTPQVNVIDSASGDVVLNGICLEAVCTDASEKTLSALYHEAREIAAEEYQEHNESGFIFAVERTPQLNKEKRFLSLFKEAPVRSEVIRNAIGSALPERSNPGMYSRNDKKRPTKASTQIMWLRTKV